MENIQHRESSVWGVSAFFCKASLSLVPMIICSSRSRFSKLWSSTPCPIAHGSQHKFSVLTHVGSTCLFPVVFKTYESWHLPLALHIPLSGTGQSCTEMEALICSFESMFGPYCLSLKPLNFCQFSPSFHHHPLTFRWEALTTTQHPPLFSLGLHSLQMSLLSGST